LWPNGLAALRELGIAADAETTGEPVATAGFRRPDGAWLSRIDAGAVRHALGAAMLAVHRADLHDHLTAAVADRVELHMNTEIRMVADGVVGDGRQTWTPDLLIAADGIGSLIRGRLAPKTRVRGVGQVAWRAVVPPAGFAVPEEIGETLGNGRRFGFAPVGDRGVYWYAAGRAAGAPAGPAAAQLSALREAFKGWHDPIPDLLAATSPGRLLRHELADLRPLPPLRVGRRTVLLGDAAHAMTPDLAQGACLALEDAVTLARLVERMPLHEALDEYDRLRRSRTHRLVPLSRRWGSVLGAGGLPARARNAALRLTPNGLTVRQLAAVAAWRPPA
jgi:2-polyprenyl-6-methoxyphenol hydroxylase-like FAD-dependent oxidoreductase